MRFFVTLKNNRVCWIPCCWSDLVLERKSYRVLLRKTKLLENRVSRGLTVSYFFLKLPKKLLEKEKIFFGWLLNQNPNQNRKTFSKIIWAVIRDNLRGNRRGNSKDNLGYTFGYNLCKINLPKTILWWLLDQNPVQNRKHKYNLAPSQWLESKKIS